MNNSIKGEKHHCSNCGAKFFDLNKKPIICPKCNTELVYKSALKTKPVISDPKIDKTILDKPITKNTNINDFEDIENDDIEEEEEGEDDTSSIVNIYE